MTASFTPNIQLTEPARGDNVGTWDTPVNANTTQLDLMIGGIAVIPVNNSNIVLNSAQAQSRNLTFNSTLTGSITVTLLASFIKNYEIQNLATGSSAFTITLETTAGGSVICAPPGQTVDIFSDGTNVKYKNLPPVGTYMDFAVSGVPLWISGCTIPPWLNCAGGTFSSAAYPALAVYLGGTTLPDCRGTVAAALDQGAGRLTNISSIFAVGGDQNLQNHVHSVSGNTGTESAVHQHAYVAPNANTTTGGGGFPAAGPIQNVTTASENATHTHNINFNSGTTGAGAGQNLPPTTIVGLRFIRAG